MTTFIDFRYARTLSSALLSIQPEETKITINPSKENYVAIEFTPSPNSQKLFELTSGEGRAKASVQIETDMSLSFQLENGQVLLKTPEVFRKDSNKKTFVFRLGTDVVGFKLQGSTYEKKIYSFINFSESLFLQLNDREDSVRIIGRGSGRAQQWANLYYNRHEPEGLGVELVFDWHHLRSGIPLSATLITEKLIERTNFHLRFHSYFLDEDASQITDFARLFSTKINPDISIHITPPMYTRLNTEKPNVGLFVYESMNVPQGIVTRCNMMDSIVTPSGFASITFKKAGVYKPIYVVPHGVDTEFYRPVSDKTPLTGGRSFNFLAISTHLQRKNIRPLVKAFLEEFREKEDVSLFLLLRPEFGITQNNVSLEFEEWEERYFQNSAPIFLGTGYVTRDTLRDSYANANAYVMPSNEGFGLTLLEAMASGTPVIALSYGGVLDFINQENGYLVPTGRSFIANDMLEYTGDRFYEPEITKLRSTMRHTFENREETLEKGKRARMDCEKHYTWDRTALEISKIIETTYNQTIKQRSRIPENSNGKQENTPLSWVLCVLDDISVSKSIKYLRSIKAADSDVLCLFTRYSRFEDVMLARKNGFLFHQWDGTYTNCQANIKSIILTPWVGILYPDEEIVGEIQDLIGFLEAQPEEVCEVFVQCNNGNNEPRFIRSTKLTANPEKVIFKDIRIQ